MESLRQERDDALAHNAQLQAEIRDVEGVAEQWSMVAEEAEERIDRIAAERDQAQRERDEAQTQITQLQEQLAAVQEQLAATKPSKTVMQLNAELEAATHASEQRRVVISDLRAQLNVKDKDIEDRKRQYRSMAENLKKERDQLRQQLEAGAPGASLDLEALTKERDRILAKTRSDKLKAVRSSLDQFIQGLAL